MKKNGSGFTIVELLIVVVVIAILAAITIVSYNGITKRAKDANALSRIDSYTKAFKLYKADKGSFPTINASESGLASSACLGLASDYPASPPYPAGSCYIQGTANPNTISESLNTQLRDYINPIPSGALDPLSVSTTVIRGMIYYSVDPTVAQIQYMLKGESQPCGRGQGINASGMTVCVVDLY